MNKKLTLGTLFHRPPAVSAPAKEQTDEAELAHALQVAEVETRFREALASGKITGDIITTDENGNIVHSTKSTNIFDL